MTQKEFEKISGLVKSKISSLESIVEREKKNMQDDYIRFFCFRADALYKVCLQLKEYRQLQELINSGRPDDVMEYLLGTADGIIDDLLNDPTLIYTTNELSNFAYLLRIDVNKDILREYRKLLGQVKTIHTNDKRDEKILF